MYGVYGRITIRAWMIILMATDSAGNLHLAMVGRLNATDTALRVLHVSWNGSSWSAPEAIVSYAEDAPEWPVINISNGNQLNVVWFCAR